VNICCFTHKVVSTLHVRRWTAVHVSAALIFPQSWNLLAAETSEILQLKLVKERIINYQLNLQLLQDAEKLINFIITHKLGCFISKTFYEMLTIVK